MWLLHAFRCLKLLMLPSDTSNTKWWLSVSTRHKNSIKRGKSWHDIRAQVEIARWWCVSAPLQRLGDAARTSWSLYSNKIKIIDYVNTVLTQLGFWGIKNKSSSLTSESECSQCTVHVWVPVIDAQVQAELQVFKIWAWVGFDSESVTLVLQHWEYAVFSHTQIHRWDQAFSGSKTYTRTPTTTRHSCNISGRGVQYTLLFLPFLL